MKILGKEFFLGISYKVFFGLVVIIVVAFLSSGVANSYFNKSTFTFQKISEEQLPLLITISKITKEVEGLNSDGSALAFTDTPLQLESLFQSIIIDHKIIQDHITDLESMNIDIAPALSKKSQLIFDNLKQLVTLTKASVDLYRRIFQISIYLRQMSESITVDLAPQNEDFLDDIQEMLSHSFSLLRDVVNIEDSQRNEEYHDQVLELRSKVSSILQENQVETNPFALYVNVIDIYGIGETGILLLSKKHLQQKSMIKDQLAQITFLIDELVIETEKLFLQVSIDIQQQSQQVTQELKVIGTILRLIPILIILSAILIFLYIRRSVIGRILALEQSMTAHVKGNLVPIPVKGSDEIASMAKSVSFFVKESTEHELILQEAKLAADKANEAKSLFLTHMSHELRTPLNAILGFCQILLKSNNTSSQEIEYINTIYKSGKQLLYLINQVLDLSTIEAGRLILNKSEFDLYKLINEVENLFRFLSNNKKLDLAIEWDDTVPQYFQNDPVKLKQILINLLNNAFKFTEKGNIILRIKTHGKYKFSDDKNNQSAKLFFEVEDTGIGIKADDIAIIFKAFEQTSAGRLKKEGTGLGLTICRSFIKIMGGQIDLESKPEKGTLVSFYIPDFSTNEHSPELHSLHSIQKETIFTASKEGSELADMHPNRGSLDLMSHDLHKQFSSLPSDLKEKLEDAVLRADMSRIEKLIIQIGILIPSLSEELLEWAHDYEYEKILSLMNIHTKD